MTLTVLRARRFICFLETRVLRIDAAITYYSVRSSHAPLLGAADRSYIDHRIYPKQPIYRSTAPGPHFRTALHKNRDVQNVPSFSLIAISSETFHILSHAPSDILRRTIPEQLNAINHRTAPFLRLNCFQNTVRTSKKKTQNIESL